MTDHNLDHVDDLSLPIALRRTRRTGTGIATVRRSASIKSKISKNPSPSVAACTLTTRELSPPTPPTTPLRRNWKKKITARGIDSKRHLSSGLEDQLSLSTGLTPMVRRTSLQPQSPGPAAVPGSSSSSKCTNPNHIGGGFQSSCSPRQPQSLVPSFSERISKSNSRSSISSIRRNVSLTMTEKMNRVYNERCKREKEAQEEIERLRAELKEKNERIEGLMSKEEVAVAEGEKRGSTAAVTVEQQQPQLPLLQQQQQQPRSLETPSNRSTFHTALSVLRRSGSEQDLGNGGQGCNGQQQQHGGIGMPLQNHNDGPGSGSETEALSLTASQFGEAIRAQLDCSTPPASGRSRPAARHYHHRPDPLRTPTNTTAAGTRPPAVVDGLGAHAELPITPCSNSRHDLDSRRTSNASTIRIHNSINDDTPTRYRITGSVAPAAPAHHRDSGHHHHQQLQDRASSSYSSIQLQQHQQHTDRQKNPESNNHPHPQSVEEIHSLTTTNIHLQASLTRTQASLRIALQTVTKFQIETEQLHNQLLLLKQEKKELIGLVTDVRSQINQAIQKRDEVWKRRMSSLREGIVEGVRGVFADFSENPEGLDSGVDGNGMEGVEVGRGGGGSRKRKRERIEEDDDEADGEEEQEEGDGNESCDLGSENWRSAAGGSTSRDSYDDGLEDMERRIMKMRARMMRKRRNGISGYVTAEVDSDPDA